MKDGHTATFIPGTGNIIYIGGITYGHVLVDIAMVCNACNGFYLKRKWILKIS